MWDGGVSVQEVDDRLPEAAWLFGQLHSNMGGQYQAHQKQVLLEVPPVLDNQ